MTDPGRPSPQRRLLVHVAVAVAIHALASAAFLAYPKSSGYFAKGKNFAYDDIILYHGFAAPILEGRWPYRDYPVEYPILSIPIFAGPLVAGKDFATYKYAFVVEMLLVDALLAYLVARRAGASGGIGRVPVALAWYSAFFLALCPLVVVRFDLVPTLLGFLAACWFSSGRTVRGGIAAALGVLGKIVPVVILPPLMAIGDDWRSKAKGLAAFSLTLGVGGAAWLWLGGEGVLRTFRYHGERGLEIESLAASGYMVAHKLAGVLIFSHFSHGGFNLSGPGARDAARLSPIIQAALLVLVAARARRAGPSESLRFAAAGLLAFLVFGKVLSPQYLIWLFPFLAVLDGPRATAARWLFLACCVLTTMIYPNRFGALMAFRDDAVVILAVRNVGLVVLFALMIGPTRPYPLNLDNFKSEI